MHYDAIVLGVGGVGSAALFHLAGRGARAVGIDRFPPGHDRGSSHGETRIIRQAYFEHPNYVPMALRAYELWRELEALRGDSLLHEVGLLQVGPPTGEVIAGARASAAQHELKIENLSPAEVSTRFPGFHVPENCDAVFEPSAGYLRVENCVRAHAEEAVRRGAELRIGEAALAWRSESGGVVVQTDRDTYRADRLVVAAGAWSGQILADLEIEFRVLRKAVYWWQTGDKSYRVERGSPTFFYETPAGFFYGFPRIDARGVKVAEHSGGEEVADPLNLNRQRDAAGQQRVAQFNAEFLPGLSSECLAYSTCMYTMTRDAHFVVDRHPREPRVVFAAGLSGHGFKFASMLGEALCQWTLDGQPAAPIEFLSCGRPALQKVRRE